MVSPNSLKKAKFPEHDQDLISRLPPNVTHKILKKLPLFMAARTSVLSKTWKDNWLSLNNLVFYDRFSDCRIVESRLDGEKHCRIITNILHFHNGPIHKFHFQTPKNLTFREGSLNFSPWLSCLSKNNVKKMTLRNQLHHSPVSITSHIFRCTNLVKLILDSVNLSSPPTDFEGFVNLRKLVLQKVSFKLDIFQSLVAKCSRLEDLMVAYCSGMNHIVIDSPSVKVLNIEGAYESLCFKNVQKINHASLILNQIKTDSVKVSESVNAMVMLASYCELQYLYLSGHFCKLLTAGGIMRSFPLEFNHLYRLSFMDLNLDDFDAFRCTCFLISSCPNIKSLIIKLTSSTNIVQHKPGHYHKKKHTSLRMVTIVGIRGTDAELKLIKHLLATSVVLENLIYICDKVDTDSELKMSKELMKLPRASPYAQLVSYEMKRVYDLIASRKYNY